MTKIAIICAGLLVTACASTASDPVPDAIGPQLEAPVEEHFLKIDLNGDGIATPYEHREYLKSEFAKKYDTDGDGVLRIRCTKEEFSKLLKIYAPRHPVIGACYLGSEATSEDFTFDDYAGVHAHWWKAVDTNSDGFVSRDEYVAAHAKP